MKATKILNFNTLTAIAALLLSACAQNGLEFGKAGFQAKAAQVVGAYSRGISKAYKSARGVAGARGAAGWGDSNAYTSAMPGYGQLYGGQVIREALYQDAQDCAEMAEGVPPTSEENYQYMIASLARCLDRIITHRNPILTFAHRNLNGQAKNQFQYLLNYRRPSTYEDFEGYDGDFGMISQFLGGGGAW